MKPISNLETNSVLILYFIVAHKHTSMLFKVKPSHLTTGHAVFLVDNHLTGTPVGPVGPGRKVNLFNSREGKNQSAVVGDFKLWDRATLEPFLS